MYEIHYTKSSAKYLKKLPKNHQRHILSVLERARIRPQAHFKRLVGETSYRLRAGNYRIIADIYAEKLCILVIKIGNRKDIYD